MTQQQFQQDLLCFNGTETWYRYSLGKLGFIYTEGVHYVAETCSAYWLLDLVASYQMYPSIRSHEHQSWSLMRQEGDTWLVTCEDGNNNELCRQEIGFSDFPFDGVELWLVDGVLLLPSEY